MTDKEAIKILLRMKNKHDLTLLEKEAISEAIGVLSWTKLAEGRLKRMKAKRAELN